MAPKHHPTPLSGGDRKALKKELGKARAMTAILAAQSAEMRAKAETMLQQADRLLSESWNDRMSSDGEPIDPSPTIDQAVNGGVSWLEIQCARCKTESDVDLAAMKHPPTTFVHDLASRDRKSTRLNSSHANISYAVFCLKKKNTHCDRIRKTAAAALLRNYNKTGAYKNSRHSPCLAPMQTAPHSSERTANVDPEWRP